MTKCRAGVVGVTLRPTQFMHSSAQAMVTSRVTAAGSANQRRAAGHVTSPRPMAGRATPVTPRTTSHAHCQSRVAGPRKLDT